MRKNKFFKLFLKIIIIVVAYGYIYFKITTMSSDWNSSKVYSYSYILLAIFLMPINWLIESVKWRFLLQDVEQISLKRSILGVLAGITTGMATPNRIGEYFGRTIVLEKRNRVKGSLATMMGSIAQVMVTVIVGLEAFLFMFYKMNFFDQHYIKVVFVGLVIAFLIFIILVYYNLQWIKRLAKWLNINQKYVDEISYLSRFKHSQLSYVIVLSSFRYVVFASQYVLLLNAFGTDVYLIEALCSIGVVYLLILFIPHFFIAELGVRTSVAVFVFQVFTHNIEPIIMAASVLWVINLALTSVIGSFQFFLFPLKVKKTSD